MGFGRKSRELHTLVGRAGSGKTTLLRLFLERSPRALVFDPLWNYSPGLVVGTRAEIVELANRAPDRFRVIFRPENVNPIDKRTAGRRGESRVVSALEFLCYSARCLAPCEVYIDELDAVCDAGYIPPELEGLVSYGRNIGVSLRGAVRRPLAVIPKKWASETTHWSIFRTVEPGDSAYLSSYTGIPAETLSAQEPLEFVSWIEGEVTYQKLAYDAGGRASVGLRPQVSAGGSSRVSPREGGRTEPDTTAGESSAPVPPVPAP